MKTLYILGLIALAATIIGLAWAEQITLTTYYPAPYGVYREMKANLFHAAPQSTDWIVPPGEEAAWEGKMYYNDGSGGTLGKGMRYYDGANWQPLGGGGVTKIPGSDFNITQNTGDYDFNLEVTKPGGASANAFPIITKVDQGWTGNYMRIDRIYGCWME